MKPHPVDLFSLIAGIGFAIVAALTFGGTSLIGPNVWAGRWIGPVILIAIGLMVLIPGRKVAPTAPTESPADLAAAEAELPPAPDMFDH